MFPTFYMNNFKPWTLHPTKSFSPHKSLTSRTPMPTPKPNNPSPHKPRHDYLPSTLPLPKHRLPARPPAEVCAHIRTDTQPCTRLTSQSQPQDISIPPPNTPSSENPKHGTTPPHDPADHTSNSDPIPPCDFQDITDVPIEPPFLRGDTAGDDPSSPSISGSDNSLEEFFGLPGLQNNIPIDPVILADDGPWGAGDLHKPVQQVDSLIIPGTICSYPEPPPILYNASDRHQGSSEGPGSQNSDTQTSDPLLIQGHRQLHPPSHHNTEPDASCFNGPSETPHGDERPKHSKRKTQQRSKGRATKRLRVPCILPTREDSFSTLRSRFLSLPLDERLQFLSWLFEGALPRCMPDTGPTTCEDGNVRSASRSPPLHEIEQSQRDCSEARGSSRKGMPWSTEEVDLLLKLRRDERRPWSEITRLFSDQYPGRSLGSLQVHWSTTLKNRTD